ncbi:MAG: histidine kinase dimerization/phospho-acceptor domain-containing protein, partial [Pseudomonadota bacterium]|nr:histidine kinase dimerization/phospho-acceptor domain-containing protein [Pseudomonadota bacterium]
MNSATPALQPALQQSLSTSPHSTLTSDSPALYLAIALCLVAVFIGDVLTPLGTAVWVLYVIPLALSLWLSRPLMPVYVVLLISLLITLNFLFDPPGMDPRIARINRVMGAGSFWVLASIGYFYIRNRNAVRREDWLRNGQQRIGELLQGELQAEELGANVLAFLSDYVGAVAGAMFVKDGPDYLRTATHGVNADGVPSRVMPGDGLLGQVAKDGKTRMLNDVPVQYLSAGCAFGRGQPRHLAMFATTADHMINGVVELGFMEEPSERTLELLERLDEAIGIALRSANYRAHLQNLLEESQRQAEELQVQGEELKVSNEELEEQSRALQESQARLEQQQAELEQTNAQLEEQTQLLEAQRDDLKKAQDALEQRSHELERASQYKSDFLANMSHELRTPLNSSLILAKLLADNPNGNLTPEQVMHAQTIQSAGNDLLNLINDILDLSKIEAGHMEIVAEPVRVA